MTTTTTLHKAGSIRAYSKRELATLYKISTRTLTRWLRPHQEKIGKREGRYYTLKQVLIIFDLIGSPDALDLAA